MIVEPKIFLIGESTVNEEGLSAFLTHLGVPAWTSDAPTDVERLTEVYGRACYKSFGTEIGSSSKFKNNMPELFVINCLKKMV